MKYCFTQFCTLVLLFLLLGSALNSQTIVNLESSPAHLYYPFNKSSYKGTGSDTQCSFEQCGTNTFKMVCGTNCGAHKNMDLYAQDWNFGPESSSDCGEKIYAPFSGQVIFVGTSNQGVGVCCFGEQVIIKTTVNNQTFAMRFAHLSNISVSNDQMIAAGTEIGSIGNTGGGCHTSCSPFTCHAHIALYHNLTTGDLDVLELGSFINDTNKAKPFLFDVNPISVNGHMPISGGSPQYPKPDLKIRFELSDAYFNSGRDFPKDNNLLEDNMIDHVLLVNTENANGDRRVVNAVNLRYLGENITYNSHQYAIGYYVEHRTFRR